MTTIAQALTSIQQRGYGSDVATAQTDGLQRAYERLIRMFRWDWGTIRYTGTLAANATSIPFSVLTRYRRIRAVRFVDYTDPEYLDYDDFYNWTDEGQTKGVPVAYTIGADSILFNSAPTSNVAVVIDYIQTPVAWSGIGVGDIPVPEPLVDWMCWMAIADICFRERDSQGRADAMDAAAQIIAEYRAQHGLRQTQTAKSVVSTGIHESYTNEDWII